MEKMRVLITVKTYPQPSRRYEETVCTAGIREGGGFVRLYPIRFRGLASEQQYSKYQWIEFSAVKNQKDPRPESYRPIPDTIVAAETLGTESRWAARRRIVLPTTSRSIEALHEQQSQHGTSLGLVRPAEITDLTCKEGPREWEPKRLEHMRQMKLFGTDYKPLPRVPYYFRYVFHCDDEQCTGHECMVEDWELGVLFFKICRQTGDEGQARAAIRRKFLDEMCAEEIDTHLFVGTHAEHPTSWLVLGVFWPPKQPQLSLDLAYAAPWLGTA